MSFKLQNKKRFGILIAILCYSYILFRLFNYQNQFDFSRSISIKNNIVWGVLLIQLFLLILNLFIESKKWKSLLSNEIKVSNSQSFKMVLAGFASGIFTPAKLGEPVGRIIFLDKLYWGTATILNYFGGIIHNIVILSLGLPCLIIHYKSADIQLSSQSKIYILIFITLIVFVIIIISFVTKISAKLNYLKRIEKIASLFRKLKAIPKHIIIKVLMLSLLRFLVYSLQLVILLYLFNAKIQFTSLIIIPIYFMLITITPSYILIDLGIRGSIALFIFSSFCIPEISIVLVVFLLWLLNQMSPALLGTIIILTKKQNNPAIKA